MQLNNNFVLTGVTQNVAHADFALGNGYAGSSDGFSHITGTDGTEQLAFVARLEAMTTAASSPSSSALFGSSLVGSQFGFQLSATSTEGFDVGLGGHNSFALRDQVVTA